MSYKIPKKIHYCWFGKNEIPQEAINYINGWKKILPDYEFFLWDEERFDINSHDYVREAYNEKKFAFVTDYVRLHALYHEGGVYMDTDVELLHSLDRFLSHRAFTGCESKEACVTGTMGAEKHHPWIKDLLEDYENEHFLLSDGSYNDLTNTRRITDLTIKKYGWEKENKKQELKEGLTIYPFDFFCANQNLINGIQLTDNTYTIHHFSGSWKSDAEQEIMKRKGKVNKIIINLIGDRGFSFLRKVKKKLTNNSDK